MLYFSYLTENFGNLNYLSGRQKTVLDVLGGEHGENTAAINNYIQNGGDPNYLYKLNSALSGPKFRKDELDSLHQTIMSNRPGQPSVGNSGQSQPITPQTGPGPSGTADVGAQTTFTDTGDAGDGGDSGGSMWPYLAGIGGLAALGGGAYAYNKYRQKNMI